MADLVSFQISVFGMGSQPIHHQEEILGSITVGAYIQSLRERRILVVNSNQAAMVMFNGQVVPTEQTLAETFESVSGLRMLMILVLPIESRSAFIQLMQEAIDIRTTETLEQPGIQPGAPPPPIPPQLEPPADLEQEWGPGGDWDAADEEDFEEEPRTERVPKRQTSPSEKVLPPRPSTSSFPLDSKSPVDFSRSKAKRSKSPSTLEQLPATGTRRATVRYYHRMNPMKVFPFLVTITEKKLQEIAQKRVSQAEGSTFEAKLDEWMEVEPILPGCTCYPNQLSFKLGQENTALHFWVVPQVLGMVKGAKVVVRQEGKQLSEVELEMKVRRPTIAIVFGIVTFIYPLIMTILRHFGIDLEAKGDTSLYLSIINSLLTKISPTLVFGVLALITIGLYWWTRPRKRDQFWDVKTAD
jgi:hypothetical protein